MTTPREMTLREVVAMAQGMVLVDDKVRLGFIASSDKAAGWTGCALFEMLVPHGVTWHRQYRQLRWASGAVMAIASVQRPEPLRGHRLAAAFLSGHAADPLRAEALRQMHAVAGANVFRCAEVENRGAFNALLRQAG
jgi:hypothetical protein